jgi:hypothetical protein
MKLIPNNLSEIFFIRRNSYRYIWAEKRRIKKSYATGPLLNDMKSA